MLNIKIKVEKDAERGGMSQRWRERVYESLHMQAVLKFDRLTLALQIYW